VIYPGSEDFSVTVVHGVFEVSAPWETDVPDAAWYSGNEGYRIGTFRFQDQDAWRAAKLAFPFNPTRTALIDQVRQKLKAMGHPAWIAFSDEKQWIEKRMAMPMEGIDQDFKQVLSVFGRPSLQKILDEALKQLEKYPAKTRDFFARIFPWLESSDQAMLSKWLRQHRGGYTMHMTPDEKITWLGSQQENEPSEYWVIDTNIWIKHPDILSRVPPDVQVLVLMIIIQELDGLKNDSDIGLFARQALESIRSSQKIRIEPVDTPDWDARSPDDLLLESAKNANAAILSYDVGMINKSKAMGILTKNMDFFIHPV
jgi:rRNA-processing protein FCF1